MDRALSEDPYEEVFKWVGEAYDCLEGLGQNEIEEAITLFRSDLMSECVEVLYRLPVAEKQRLGLQEFMTAAEQSSLGFETMVAVLIPGPRSSA